MTIQREEFHVCGPNNLNCPMHINPELEIVYVKEGSIEINYGTSSLTVTGGKAAIIFPYWVHKFIEKEGADVRVLMFHPSVAKEPYFNSNNLVPSQYMFSLTAEEIVYIDSLLRKKSLTGFAVKSLYYVCINAFLSQVEIRAGEENNGL